MTCIDDGMLRARLDGELTGAELAEVNQHLSSCADCRTRMDRVSSEMSRTQNMMANLPSPVDDAPINPAVAYAHFTSQFGSDTAKRSWITRLFAPAWRPAWGLAAAAVVIAVFIGVNPARTWAQRILAMLRVKKIAVVTIDPTTLMNNATGPDSRPYKLMNQFIADNVVVTIEPGKPDVVSSTAKAAQLAGFPIRTIGTLGAPQNIEIHGETAFQMTINRERIETLLDEVGRSDVRIPESANGALIAVHIPKTVVTTYGDCPVRGSFRNANPQSRADALAERKMERMANLNTNNCTFLVEAQSPTVSVPPDLNMADIAEAALELAGMTPAEAHSFCQTVDWTSTLVVPIPRNSSSSENVAVDGVEGTLITETLPQGNRYSLLWIKNGVIHSLVGHGNASDALTLAASLR
jgi:hypothetical protein